MFPTGMEWSIVVFSCAKYCKKPYETQNQSNTFLKQVSGRTYDPSRFCVATTLKILTVWSTWAAVLAVPRHLRQSWVTWHMLRSTSHCLTVDWLTGTMAASRWLRVGRKLKWFQLSRFCSRCPPEPPGHRRGGPERQSYPGKTVIVTPTWDLLKGVENTKIVFVFIV